MEWHDALLANAAAETGDPDLSLPLPDVPETPAKGVVSLKKAILKAHKSHRPSIPTKKDGIVCNTFLMH